MGWHDLFVYGTLKKDEKNHSILGCCHYLGEGYLRGPYQMYLHPEGQYPLVIHSPGSSEARIFGELWKVEENHLVTTIDPFENVPIEYSRERVQVSLNQLNPSKTEACAYFYQQMIDDDQMIRIYSGRFLSQGLS